MSRQPSPLQRVANVERMLRDLEGRVAGLSRAASTAPLPRGPERMADAISAALSDIAERFRGRARSVGRESIEVGDDLLHFGNDALRKLTQEVEQRPFVTLAIAVGVGAIAAGLLARRS
jgi:ElaB/YqjD/DUF883 family membrane-anchored ribosome-binding protein